MNFEIASMIAHDYDALMQLWSLCEGIGYESRDSFRRFLERNPGMSVTAWKNGGIVGAVLCGHDGRRGYLYHLAVHPDHRREGIGEALVEKCIDRLSEYGINRCSVFVYNDNDSGLEFWKSIGWRLRDDLQVLARDFK